MSAVHPQGQGRSFAIVAAGLLLLSLGREQWRRPFDVGWAEQTRVRWAQVSPLAMGEPVNINQADEALLMVLPGVGPALASRIVQHRQRRGDFRSLRALRGVRGIGPSKQQVLSRLAKVDDRSQPLRRKVWHQPALPMPIKTASVWALQRLPGVGAVLAGRIGEFRESHGPFESIDDLIQVHGIGRGKLAKLRQHVRVVAVAEPS